MTAKVERTCRRSKKKTCQHEHSTFKCLMGQSGLLQEANALIVPVARRYPTSASAFVCQVPHVIISSSSFENCRHVVDTFSRTDVYFLCNSILAGFLLRPSSQIPFERKPDLEIPKSSESLQRFKDQRRQSFDLKGSVLLSMQTGLANTVMNFYKTVLKCRWYHAQDLSHWWSGWWCGCSSDSVGSTYLMSAISTEDITCFYCRRRLSKTRLLHSPGRWLLNSS